jgi:hypothetical protein
MNVDIVNNITASGTCLIINGSARSENVVDQTYLTNEQNLSNNNNNNINNKIDNYHQYPVVQSTYLSDNLLIFSANNIELFRLQSPHFEVG